MHWRSRNRRFLSIQAQDFIEELRSRFRIASPALFLSIQAQDFIEDLTPPTILRALCRFLSIQAQDFIEEFHDVFRKTITVQIPEHSSSGLH